VGDQERSSDAQRKVEERNFDIRKNLLEYDDVMSEQRKTVYKMRQQLLLGIYKPEKIDEDGKPTGKMREIAVDPRIAGEVKQAIVDMVMHHGTPIGIEGKTPPKTPEEVEEIYSMTSLQQDIYQFWGYRFDFKDGDGKQPKKVYERLLEEIPLSLTEQREQLLDLLDTIVGAIVEECCPAKKPPEDWDWKGIKSGYIEHFASKPPEVDHLHDPEQIAKVLFEAAEKWMQDKEKEMGTELLLRVLRHLYLEEIDRAVGRAPHEHGAPARRHRPPRLRSARPEAGVQEGGLRRLHHDDGGDEQQRLHEALQGPGPKENDIERMEREDAEKHAAQQRAMQMRHGGEVAGGDEEQPVAARPSARPQPRVQVQPTRREGPKIGRNDPCPCGSGQKFKKCHGEALEDDGVWQRRRRQVRCRQGRRDASRRVVGRRLLQSRLRVPAHDRAGREHRRSLEAHRREPLG
jgi:preprotein translocase subunit SecA